MPRGNLPSLTKEFPLKYIDKVITSISPNMRYQDLRRIHKDTSDIPNLVVKKYILLNGNTIVYDKFLSIVASEGIDTIRVRKIMYFIWAYRDARIGEFIRNRIANEEGKWISSEISNTGNSSFFAPSSSAKKIRSNIEFFLEETGIYDGKSVNLDLKDNWLIDAVNIAAQYQPNREQALYMQRQPISYLITNKLNGLANASREELLKYQENIPIGVESYVGDEDMPDVSTEISPIDWKKRPPVFLKKEIISCRDSVSIERANTMHWQLEKIFYEAAKAKGYNPKTNNQIDIYFPTKHGTVLAEIKSCSQSNIHHQVRLGISQLLEYKYQFSKLLGPHVIPTLILETEPSANKKWLTDYVKSIPIVPAWRCDDKLVTKDSYEIPAPLEGIVTQ